MTTKVLSWRWNIPDTIWPDNACGASMLWEDRHSTGKGNQLVVNLSLIAAALLTCHNVPQLAQNRAGADSMTQLRYVMAYLLGSFHGRKPVPVTLLRNRNVKFIRKQLLNQSFWEF